jgi:hypothetical protein
VLPWALVGIDQPLDAVSSVELAHDAVIKAELLQPLRQGVEAGIALLHSCRSNLFQSGDLVVQHDLFSATFIAVSSCFLASFTCTVCMTFNLQNPNTRGMYNEKMPYKPCPGFSFFMVHDQ